MRLLDTLRKMAKFQSRRLTVVAEALSRRTDLGVVAHIATLIAGTTRQRHLDVLCYMLCFKVSTTINQNVPP